MARAKKAARNICVDHVAYRWRASGNDDWIDLVIWPADQRGAAIEARLGYGEVFSAQPGSSGAYDRIVRQVIVTNRIVRRVIELARHSQAYDPTSSGPPLTLGAVDHAIDLSDAIRCPLKQ